MFEFIQAQLDSLLPSAEATTTGFALVSALAVFVAVVAIALLISAFGDPTRKRLKSVGGAEAQSDEGGGLARSAEAVGDFLMPKAEEERTRIENTLVHAGIRSPDAIRVFYGTKLLLIAGLGIGSLAVATTVKALPLATSISMVVAATILGYLVPSWWLSRAARNRKLSIRRGLPDMLDLLVICSEAGLGLAAAIHRVAGDIEVGHPELADELTTFSLQTQAGLDHRSALRDFEQRTGVDEVRGLVSTLLQSMTLGTSVADTLRVFADELRDKRMQQAEEKAAMVSTKMLFPLIFFLLPGFMLVAIGPPLLGAMRAMQGIG